MYSLFLDSKPATGGVVIQPKFLDARSKIAFDIERIRQHYQKSAYTTQVHHLLCRLILTMNTPMKYDTERYYEASRRRYLEVANALHLTSQINQGQWFYGVFYHECPELIFVHCAMDDPIELEKDWRNLQPVKVLEHPVSNLSYMFPNGLKHNTERGMAVIVIDVPMLMLQFKCFMKEQLYIAEQNGGSYLGVTHFMYRYVFPNMLYSQTDIVIFNRLSNLLYGAPMGDSIRKHIFHISDYSLMVDRVLETSLKYLQNTRLSYTDVLNNVPHVFNKSPLEMPNIPPVLQVWWGLFLTRIRQMEFLIDIGGDKDRSFNTKYLNELFIDLKALRQAHVYPERLDSDVRFDVLDRIERLTTIVRK